MAAALIGKRPQRPSVSLYKFPANSDIGDSSERNLSRFGRERFFVLRTLTVKLRTETRGYGAMHESVPMTRDGYNKIKSEIERLENEELPVVTEKIAEARAEGDLKENAEYHAQRENQGLLMAKIGELKDKLARATIIDPSKLPKDEVVFGCTVTVEDAADGEAEEFTLVGAGEEDYDSGRILVTSPFGQGLLGKKVGELAEIEVPAGTLKFKIVKIAFGE